MEPYMQINKTGSKATIVPLLPNKRAAVRNPTEADDGSFQLPDWSSNEGSELEDAPKLGSTY